MPNKFWHVDHKLSCKKKILLHGAKIVPPSNAFRENIKTLYSHLGRVGKQSPGMEARNEVMSGRRKGPPARRTPITI